MSDEQTLQNATREAELKVTWKRLVWRGGQLEPGRVVESHGAFTSGDKLAYEDHHMAAQLTTISSGRSQVETHSASIGAQGLDNHGKDLGNGGVRPT